MGIWPARDHLWISVRSRSAAVVHGREGTWPGRVPMVKLALAVGYLVVGGATGVLGTRTAATLMRLSGLRP